MTIKFVEGDGGRLFLEETIKRADAEPLIAASAHYVGNSQYVLRTQGMSGVTVNWIVDAAAFEHLKKMVENAIINGLEDLQG